jgi:hypothetical protein
VFEGWNENPICFPPTYKFIINSDEYFGRDTPLGAKRRTLACAYVGKVESSSSKKQRQQPASSYICS